MRESIEKFYILNSKEELSENWIDEKNGKVIYEVLKIINGKPLFYKEHYERMVNSFKLNDKSIVISEEDLLKDIYKLILINEKQIGNIKITYNTFSNNLKIFFIKHSYPTEEMYEKGVKTVLYFGERNNPNAKVVDNNFRSKVTEYIKSKNAFEGILVNHNGFITEGSKSNIFFIKDEKLFTSKVSDVLPGVTRSEIIKMALENSIEVIEKDINYKDLSEYDALFISGTSPNILPIKEVDDLKFNVKNEFLISLKNMFDKEIENNVK